MYGLMLDGFLSPIISLSFGAILLLTGCIPGAKGPLLYKFKEVEVQVVDEFSLENEPATFEKVTEYIFKDKCIRCHRKDRAKLGVDLSEYEKVFGYSDYFQPIVTKGDPDQSGVYTEVARGAMPPKEPLTPEEVAFIKRWIEEGALPKMTRRYRKNDWWDLVTVIEQELDRDRSYRTYYNLVDELKWRLVESVSEGGNHKIKVKAKELLESFLANCSDHEEITTLQREEINALFDFILSSPKKPQH